MAARWTPWRKRPRPLRALALAALLSRELRRRLPAVPRLGHGHRARPRPESRPRNSIREKGCIGCHQFQGFDNQDEQLVSARASRSPSWKTQKQADQLEIAHLNKNGDTATRQRHGQPLLRAGDQPDRHRQQIDAQVEQLDQRSHNLLQEIKKVGPDLKEVRMKIHKEWIPYWLEHTREFRPTTKMPQFRLQDDEIQAISAYIWQSAITGPELPKQAPGNAAHGKDAVRIARLPGVPFDRRRREHGRRRFCRESVAASARRTITIIWCAGFTIRASARVPIARSKKAISVPKITPSTICRLCSTSTIRAVPNDGHELVVQQPTVMPSLRLSVEDARDIASYLDHPEACRRAVRSRADSWTIPSSRPRARR